jgi:hypothetical protein
MEVLHRWHTDSQYLGPYGIPLKLEFEDLSGRNFGNLVSTVDPNVSAGLVLDELLRVGSVVYWGDTHFRTIYRAFVASGPMSRERIEYFRESLTRLAKTLEHNLNPCNAAKRLERFVVADRGLPEELLPKFESFAQHRAELFLSDLDNWLTPHSGADANDPRPRIGAGVNVFLYVESPCDQRPLSTLIQQPRKHRV